MATPSQTPVTLQDVIAVVNEVTSGFRFQNVIFGDSNDVMGMRNVIYGDGLKARGDYNVLIGEKATIPSYLISNAEGRKNFLAIHQDYLDMYRDMNGRGLLPAGFFAKAEPVLQTILALVRGLEPKAAEAKAEEATEPVISEPAEPRGVKIEPVVDEPTSMKK